MCMKLDILKGSLDSSGKTWSFSSYITFYFKTVINLKLFRSGTSRGRANFVAIAL